MKTWYYTALLILTHSVLLQTAAFAQTSDIQYGPRTFDVENKWTAIVSAYEPEIEAIDKAFAKLDDVKIDQVMNIKGVRYQIGSYKGEPVVIFTTGISVPNAAMTMQMALDYFPIDKVVMMGIAGAINPSFEPGDIAIPARWYFHDESVYVNPDIKNAGKYLLPDYYENALKRYKARELEDPNMPKYKNFGMIHPEEMAVIKEGWESPKQMPYFSATPHLLDLSQKALDTIEQITMPSGKPISVSIGGNGVTGSVFADNGEYRIWLRDVFNAEVTEMESAAVGMVCFINDVDWVIIRSVSDLAGGQHGKNVENVYDAIASGTGTKLMMGLLDQIVTTENTK
ncbi:5'-methylthioadenosine/S-adenosylhomocysteine nucleosidase [Glaciecola petra]|uniref:5'-methylthioadenosine/S-adenosylhomocysteine nucleosidase n=1 Tax=Glaciecola petra TaxID=3075602 RepID=A0ABU2ZX70_9ALTE|nr:5'-methylthioadenosine/S-adenosylhomocysteine nucleosidase [Aestuariibacter sp. P117]MDT0596164.1 5'-methylthioadenosine/S-adenosylhomocysteine nucleosidase [Aestuariibacter sp. P117]